MNQTQGNGYKEAIVTLKERVSAIEKDQKSDVVDITELKVMMQSTIKSVDNLTNKMDGYITQDKKEHKQIELDLLDVKKDIKSSAKKWAIVGGFIVAITTGLTLYFLPRLF